MNIFKSLATALTACAVTVAPSLARIDAYTDNLLRTVDNSSVTVLIDPHYCDNSIYGSWNPQELELVVCTHGSVDAEDHDTVRHEVWHIVQHCMTDRDATSLQPIFRDPQEYRDEILSRISKEKVRKIMDAYPEFMHLVEIEAFVAAATLTSQEVEAAFIKACIDR